MQSDFRKLTRCLVCGFTEVHTDEAVEPIPVFLAECPRCEHRWTESPPTLRPARRPALSRARAREVVSAA